MYIRVPMDNRAQAHTGLHPWLPAGSLACLYPSGLTRSACPNLYKRPPTSPLPIDRGLLSQHAKALLIARCIFTDKGSSQPLKGACLPRLRGLDIPTVVSRIWVAERFYMFFLVYRALRALFHGGLRGPNLPFLRLTLPFLRCYPQANLTFSRRFCLVDITAELG